MQYRLRTLLIVLAVLPALGEISARGEEQKPVQLVIVSLRGRNGEERLARYAARFPVTPERAKILVEKYWESLPVDKRPFFPRLIAMINDEYHYVPPHKTSRLLLSGYRVNARTGTVRFLTAKSVRAEYGERFPKGYVPSDDVAKYEWKDEGIEDWLRKLIVLAWAGDWQKFLDILLDF